jgi:hypothetical protein
MILPQAQRRSPALLPVIGLFALGKVHFDAMGPWHMMTLLNNLSYRPGEDSAAAFVQVWIDSCLIAWSDYYLQYRGSHAGAYLCSLVLCQLLDLPTDCIPTQAAQLVTNKARRGGTWPSLSDKTCRDQPVQLPFTGRVDCQKRTLLVTRS